MKASGIVILCLAAAGLATPLFWDSFAEDDQGIVALLWGLINNTQADVEDIKMRMAVIEANNTELLQRIGDLERQLSNMTAQSTVCPAGYWLNADTNACEMIAQEDSTSCPAGYWLNADTNACEKIAEEGPTSCPAGYWLNADTNACEKIAEEGPTSCPAGYWLNADTNACEKIAEEGPTSCPAGYWLNADTNACEKIQDP